MKKIFIPLLAAVVAGTSCGSTPRSIFAKKTPIEKYEEKLEEGGLDKTPEGRQWLAASAAALQHPQAVQLPYRHIGNFPTDKPRALGLAFMAKRGERLTFAIDKEAQPLFPLYAELYSQDANGDTRLMQSPDTNVSEFSYDVAEGGNYILKIQPQIGRSGGYRLSVSVGPSLGFPVSGTKASVGSFWGAGRDGGKRSHEGIDIFAPKRTPAVAAADGFIVGVREGGIGGKTVWLRPDDKDYTLYYAHLDEQLVQEGQRVTQGQTVGLVGNTGNAKNTPSHLHFGVYGYGGAVDPYPFVNKGIRTAPALAPKKLAEALRLVKDYKTEGAVVKKNTPLVPIAFMSKGYIAELPDGRLIQAAPSLVQSATEPVKKAKTSALALLLNSPVVEVATGITLQAGTAVSVLGYYNGFAFVRSGEGEGWVTESVLKG